MFLYHGTAARFEKDIFRYGLRPGRCLPESQLRFSSNRDSVYLAPVTSAYIYAARWDQKGRGNNGGIVFEVNINRLKPQFQEWANKLGLRV